MEAKTVGKTLADPLIYTLADTLSEVVAKIIDTLTCVEVNAPVKTEADTLAGLQVSTVVDTLNEVKAEELFYMGVTRFRKCRRRLSLTH